MSSKKAQKEKRYLELVEDPLHRTPRANMSASRSEATRDSEGDGNKENWSANRFSTQAKRGKTNAEAVMPRDSWDAPGIVELGNFSFSVKVGDNVTLHDCTMLAELFPEFAPTATKFAGELELEPKGFIATGVHSLVWPTPRQKRHHVYTQISGQAGYVERKKYPQYLKDAVRSTWHSPGEEFSDPESDAATEIIELNNDSDPDYDPE